MKAGELGARRLPKGLGESLVEGRCALFLGAGFSFHATGATWGSLLEDLKRDLEGAPLLAGWEGLDPLDRAQVHVAVRGRRALEEILLERLQIPPTWRPQRTESILLALPVDLILTPNYDDLIERTLDHLGLAYRVVVDEADALRPHLPGERRIIKMHGDLRTSDSIVLTREDFLDYRQKRPAMARLVESVLLNHTLLVYGYSLTDPNFLSAFHNVAALSRPAEPRPCHFALTLNLPPYWNHFWMERGVMAIDSPSVHQLQGKVQRLVRAVEAKRHLQSHLGEQGGVLGIPQVGDDLRRILERLEAHAETLLAVADKGTHPRNSKEEGREGEGEPPERKELGVVANALQRMVDLGFHPSPKRLLRLGVQLYRDRDWEGARKALEDPQVGRLKGADARDRCRWLGRLYVRQGDARSGYRVLGQALSLQLPAKGPPSFELLADISWTLKALNLLIEQTLRWGRSAAALRLCKEGESVLGSVLDEFLDARPQTLWEGRVVGYGCTAAGRFHQLHAQAEVESMGRGEEISRLVRRGDGFLERAAAVLSSGEREAALGFRDHLHRHPSTGQFLVDGRAISGE